MHIKSSDLNDMLSLNLLLYGVIMTNIKLPSNLRTFRLRLDLHTNEIKFMSLLKVSPQNWSIFSPQETFRGVPPVPVFNWYFGIGIRFISFLYQTKVQ